MSFSEILIVAFALAVDALVCSIITGKSSTNRLSRIVTGLTVALTFGFFQFLMPVIGFFAGKQLENTLAAVDHWIAFVLLAGVGANMLKEAFSSYLEQHTQEASDSSETLSSQPQSNVLLHVGLISLVSMAIGTSIDALAVGVSYGLVGNTIWLSAIVIGLVCFALSLVGYFMGQILSTLKSIDPILNVLGALVLISIGINILIGHQAMGQLTHLFAQTYVTLRLLLHTGLYVEHGGGPQQLLQRPRIVAVAVLVQYLSLLWRRICGIKNPAQLALGAGLEIDGRLVAYAISSDIEIDGGLCSLGHLI